MSPRNPEPRSQWAVSWKNCFLSITPQKEVCIYLWMRGSLTKLKLTKTTAQTSLWPMSGWTLPSTLCCVVVWGKTKRVGVKSTPLSVFFPSVDRLVRGWVQSDRGDHPLRQAHLPPDCNHQRRHGLPQQHRLHGDTGALRQSQGTSLPTTSKHFIKSFNSLYHFDHLDRWISWCSFTSPAVKSFYK